MAARKADLLKENQKQPREVGKGSTFAFALPLGT
jgi:hypothetical protein